MLIATWNVNSVRARLPLVTQWLQETAPDILLLQETKCQENDFPRLAFETLGYRCAVVGQKSYNGVALLSKGDGQKNLFALPDNDDDPQARYIESGFGGTRIASVYAPNGNPLGTEKFDYKMNWMEKLKDHIKKMLQHEVPFILGGDFNVLPEEIDVHNPKGWENDALFHPRTRQKWREVMNLGLTDAFRALYPTKQAYTFWDYKSGAWEKDLGLRIDHFLLSPEAAARIKDCRIDRTPRGWDQPSDHTPVLIEITY